MKTPFFSVVIPTRGRSFLVGNAIASVLRQTFPDVEVIISDNDDGDATQKAVATFQDNRVRYHRTGNLSMPDNWEAGGAQAQGEYVLFLADKQALKLRTLEDIHAALGRQPADCLKWLCDVLDDSHAITHLNREKCDGSTRLISSDEILRRFTTDRLGSVNQYIPLGQQGAFSRRLLEKIKSGPVGKLCPATNPDYTLAFQSLAFSDAVLYLDRAYTVTSIQHGNGQSSLVKSELFTRFIREVGGEGKICEFAPIKAITVHNNVYNDFLRLQKMIRGRLAQFPLSWTNYFLDCHEDILRSQQQGADRSQELTAWREALREQPIEVQQVVSAGLRVEETKQKDLHHRFKDLRRQLGFTTLEWAVKNRVNVWTGRNPNYRSVLDYVTREHEQHRAKS